MTKKYTIYAFCDPVTAAVRYIGVTTLKPSARFAQIKHKYKRGEFKEVGAWIWALLDQGIKPLIIVLEENPVDGFNGERRWIAAYRAAGADLFNKAAGGVGPSGIVHTEEWKRHNSLVLTGMKRSDETRARIAASKLGKARPDLGERNKSNRRLSPDDIAEIKAMLDEGYTMKDIGTSFGVSAGLVCMIKSGKRYAS